MKFNIRIKLIAFTFCIILLVGGSISLYSIAQVRQRTLESFKDDASKTATLLSRTIINDLYFLDISSLRHTLRNARVNPDIRRTYVMDSEGVLLTDGTGQNPMGGQKLTDTFTHKLLQSKDWLLQVEDRTLKVGSPLFTSDGARIGHLQVEFTLDRAYEIARVTTKASLTITLVCLIIGAALAFVMARGFSRPIESIVKAALAIGQGHLDTRLSMRRGDEFASLAESINRMAGALQSHAAETEEKTRQLEETNRMLSALHAVVVAAGESPGLDQVFDTAIGKITDMFHFEATRIHIYDERKDSLLLRASFSSDPDRFTEARSFARGQGIVGMVAESGKPLIFEDVQTDPLYQSISRTRVSAQFGYRFFAVFPIRGKLKTLGTLGCVGTAPRKLGSGEIQLLEAIAERIGVAIENRELYEQLRQKVEELQQKTAELERANRVKDEFLSVMSHELRTPLNVVMGYTGMIKDKVLGEINPEQEKALDKVIRRATDQLTIINNILVATQMEAEGAKAEGREVSLSAFVEDLKRDYLNPLGKDLTLHWDTPSDLPVVKSDGEKLKHILQNLIHNAIKFTERGQVKVRARFYPDSKMVEFKVTDTGIGIAGEFFPVIFEKFRMVDSSETRLYGGVGLGLYIAKTFTEVLGGKIGVESQLGKGSTFTVSVPCEAIGRAGEQAALSASEKVA